MAAILKSKMAVIKENINITIKYFTPENVVVATEIIYLYSLVDKIWAI